MVPQTGLGTISLSLQSLAPPVHTKARIRPPLLSFLMFHL